MGATDPLKNALTLRMGFRTVEPMEPAQQSAGTGRAEPRLEPLRCRYRPQEADFYCWKYGVWYGLMDCCYRHDRKTYPGCADCGQGRNNLRQNRRRYLHFKLRRSSPFAR
jgi:hypothetical protein